MNATKCEIMGWTTYGSVRDQCGHLHRTRAAAERCEARDQAACHGQHGYSDRNTYAVDQDGCLTYDDGDYVRGGGGVVRFC